MSILKSDHPVWSVYDEQRTARLNVLYLESQIRTLRGLNTWAEVLIAISTSSSVAGIWFLQDPVGSYAWRCIGAIAVILAVIKPILKLPDKARRKEELVASYRILDHDLHCIHIEVRHRGEYDEIQHREFVKALKRKSELVKKNDSGMTNERLRSKIEARVMQELPSDSFYVPEK